MEHVKNILKEAGNIETLCYRPGLFFKTGFNALDAKIEGYKSEDIVVVGGRPGMGKTSFCLSTALHLAREKNNRIVIFSNEMCSEVMIVRLLSMISGVAVHAIRCGTLNNDDTIKLKAAEEELSSLNIWIDDTINLSIDALKQNLKNADGESAQNEVKTLIIIDDFRSFVMRNIYCQEDAGKRLFGEVLSPIRGVAVAYGVVFLLGTTLLRRPGEETGPKLAQLGMDNMIEHLATKIFLLYRKAYYDRRVKDTRTEIIVAKNTGGWTGSCNLSFNEECTMFNDCV